jgi:hypothetical protein
VGLITGNKSFSPAAPKPELKTETIRQFDSLVVGAGLFRLTPAAVRFALEAYVSPN